MKHVVDTNEVAHLWMHQTQHDARNGGGNFYFDGDTIYSYGSHFPIARHVTNIRKERAILFTTRGYSNTTSKHIGMVRGAIHGNNVKVLKVCSINKLPSEALTEFNARIVEAERSCFGPTGRFRQSVWDYLGILIGQANEYSEFFGSRKRWSMPENTDTIKAEIKRNEAKQARQQKATAKKERIAAELRVKQQLELLAKWRRGKAHNAYFDWSTPVALRVVGDEVETSKGVRFPITHARRGIVFVRAVVAKKREYVRNGKTFYLGVYALDRIDVDGTVHAGCHVVSFAEVERLAKTLKIGK